MSSFPSTPRSAALAWAQAHTQVFADNDTQIGLTEIQCTAYTSLVNATAAAIAAQTVAKEAAQTATLAANQKYADMRRSTNLLIRNIRTYAGNTENPNVYVLAQIPAPATGGVAPPPAKPSDLSIELNNASGSLTLRWKADNPKGTQGTSYIIRRKLPGQAEFAFIGVTGTKKFVDNTFIAGPDSVQYTVQGQRADSAGPESDPFVINFGKTPTGQATAFVAGASQPMRIAA